MEIEESMKSKYGDASLISFPEKAHEKRGERERDVGLRRLLSNEQYNFRVTFSLLSVNLFFFLGFIQMLS